MKRIKAIEHIRKHHNIRTRHSHLTSTGPGHNFWPRLKETEQLQANEKRLPSRMRRIWR